jgi:hypothetical protein
VDQWEKLPWWQQWMYMEELQEYLRVKAGGRPEDRPSDFGTSDGDILELVPNANYKTENVTLG